MLGQDFESCKDQGHYVVENEMTILAVCFVLTGFMFCKWYRCYRLLLPREVPAEIPTTYLPSLPYFSPHKPVNDTRPSTTSNDEGNTAVIVMPLTSPLPIFDAPFGQYCHALHVNFVGLCRHPPPFFSLKTPPHAHRLLYRPLSLLDWGMTCMIDAGMHCLATLEATGNK